MCGPVNVWGLCHSAHSVAQSRTARSDVPLTSRLPRCRWPMPMADAAAKSVNASRVPSRHRQVERRDNREANCSERSLKCYSILVRHWL